MTRDVSAYLVADRKDWLFTTIRKILTTSYSLTPVKTGHLQSNLQISFDGEAEVIPGVRPNPISDELSKLRNFDGLELSIINPVHYAPYVEFGSPTNTPALMLTTAVESVS